MLLEPGLLQTMKTMVCRISSRKTKGPKMLDRSPRDCVRVLSFFNGNLLVVVVLRGLPASADVADVTGA